MPVVLLLPKPISAARSQQENKRFGFVLPGGTTARSRLEHKPASAVTIGEAAQLSSCFTREQAVLLRCCKGNQPLWISPTTAKNKYLQAELEREQQAAGVARERSGRCVVVATVFPGILLSRRGDGGSCCCADHQPEGCYFSGNCKLHSWTEILKSFHLTRKPGQLSAR